VAVGRKGGRIADRAFMIVSSCWSKNRQDCKRKSRDEEEEESVGQSFPSLSILSFRREIESQRTDMENGKTPTLTRYVSKQFRVQPKSR